jgi:hypothetical protein
MLCVLNLSVFSGVEEEDDEPPEEVLVLVQQETTENSRIKLVSCYSTDDDYYIDLYTKAWFIRQKHPSECHGGGDKRDLADAMKSLRGREEFQRAAVAFAAALERRRLEYAEYLKRGYKLFQELLKNHTPPKAL